MLSSPPAPTLSRRGFILSAAGLLSAAFGLAAALRTGKEPTTAGRLRAALRKRIAPTMWIGAVTADSAVVKAYLGVGVCGRVLLREAGSSSAEASFEIAPLTARSAIGSSQLMGLRSGTRYQYRLEVGSRRVAGPPGRFQTFSKGLSSFCFSFASCARTGSDHEVFSTIRRKDPLFFLHLGDLHYSNINKDKPELFRAAYDSVLTSPTQSELYRDVPLAYMWDDHDFGPNDSDSLTPGRRAARLTYQEYVPHYPLAAGAGNVPIYQAFTVGRVRFLLLDLRSERSRSDMRDGPHKTLLGRAQMAWLKQELLAARDSARLIFIASSVPWIGEVSLGDGWAAYDTERQELARFIATTGLKNICFLCGDAHMLAADDGTNNGYGGTRPGFPVLHGSSLDRGYSYKGGPYSHGWYLPEKEEGCFGWVEVRDEGSRIAVDFSGRTHRDEAKIQLSFDVAS